MLNSSDGDGGAMSRIVMAGTAAVGQQQTCDKHALTDFFGWMIQGLLAGLAFTCLIGKSIYRDIDIY